jgi:hypothetical protein
LKKTSDLFVAAVAAAAVAVGNNCNDVSNDS